MQPVTDRNRRKNGSKQVKSDVLMICRANHCRSPMMEHLFRAALDRRAEQDPSGAADTDRRPWVIASAGTHAAEGVAPHPLTVRALQKRQIDVSGWVSRRLTPEIVAGAALILTAELDQRRAVVEMVPQAVGRTFALLPFAAWLRAGSHPDAGEPGAPPTDTLIARALDGRTRVQPLAPTQYDLADPLGRRLRRFEICAGIIEGALPPLLLA